MEDFERVNTREQDSQAPKVKVEFDPALLNKEYSLGINAEAFGGLLRDLGVPDDYISSTTVRAQSDYPHKTQVRGHFQPETRTISIFTDQLWEKYSDAMRISEEITQGKRAHGNPYKGILYTKRLHKYLKNAPPERALDFAERLINQGIQRQAIAIAMHESRHLLDDVNQVNFSLYDYASALYKTVIGAGNGLFLYSELPHDNPVSIAAAIGFGIFSGKSSEPVTYYFNPAERNARRFANENKADPRYKDLIIFVPYNLYPKK